MRDPPPFLPHVDADVWVPVDSDDEKLQKLFVNGIGNATDKVLVDIKLATDAKPVKKFILESEALQAYVVSASDLPKNDVEFESLLPKDKCKKLTDVDSDIYKQTKDTMIGVATSCATFADHGMPKMLLSATSTISYCDSALDNLERDGQISLRHNLNILTDAKYETNEDWDQEFLDARVAAQFSLESLSEEANKKHRTISDISAELIAFRQKTMDFKGDIDFLRKQYKTGPVKNKDPNFTTPYALYLNAELQKRVDDINRFITKAEKDRDTASTGLIIGFVFLAIPPIGVIAITCGLSQYIDLRNKIVQLEKDLEKARQEQGELTTLIEKVNVLLCQFELVENKMSRAIAALGELGKLFLDQVRSYDNLRKYLNDLGSATKKLDALKLRQKFIARHLDKAIAGFEMLRKTAAEFNDTVLSQQDLASWTEKAKKEEKLLLEQAKK